MEPGGVDHVPSNDFGGFHAFGWTRLVVGREPDLELGAKEFCKDMADEHFVWGPRPSL